ncbi:hypothetical protein [Thermococcus camini]|uniref:Uncharacterized protein n=1 Tax=Thermococcus camini TaxID=2016373 RepID=A0A7G2D7X8_9EURY|nr:hypothetical protein [Thermococcus camini]CAD5244565.1 conserved exported protein of unknown function [Thermococcus camini]
MKKLIILVFVVLLLPRVSADSSITGWFSYPFTIDPGTGEVRVGDVSLDDGSVLVYPGGYSTGMSVLHVGESLAWNDREFDFRGGIYSGDSMYLNVSYRFPYLLEGEELLFGRYRMVLESVNEKTVTLNVSLGDRSAELALTGGKDASIGNLRISATPMPVLFDGYLRRGRALRVGGWFVEFGNYTVTSRGGELEEIVEVFVNKKRYLAEPGDTIEVDGLVINVGDLVGSEYLKVHLRLRGAYLDVDVLPSFEGWLSEGKTEKLGPYIIRVEKVLDDGGYVSIRNPCGRVLRSGFVYAGNVSSGIYYGGLLLGATGTKPSGGTRELRIVAFLNDADVPEPGDAAMLNVSLDAPDNATQLQPFEARVVITNTGPGEVRYIEVIPNFTSGFRILGDYPEYIPTIPKGGRVEFSMTIVPVKAGNLTLGDVAIVGHAPYDLSCYGMVDMTFTSERRVVHVGNAEVKYAVAVKALNGTVGTGIPLNITVTNTGNTGLPFNITVALPEDFAAIARNFTINGKWLGGSDSLGAGESRTYSMEIVPLAPGEYTITAGVESAGHVFYNSTRIVVGPQPTSSADTAEDVPTPPAPGNATTFGNGTNTTCEPEVVTKVVTVQVASNTTCGDDAKTGISQGRKLPYAAGSFVAGMVFILLLAWIAARLEES